ncbi:MAG: tripartite tricarboxylate transporter substrate-binding protein [Alphaproteobacteria bacterium]|nr:tripartite tricarboxylate transporter substrate-binding protein [Alphaproteobacteria bacterium]
MRITKQMERFGLGLALVLVMALAQAWPMAAARADWKPVKPVEFVIMAGKGGGADKMARFINSIIVANDLSSQPFVPVNKPEKSGAEALTYLKKNKGNPHVILVTLNSFYTTPLRRPELKIDISTFTPIARMAEDSFVLWVQASTKIKSLEQFVSAAKQKGNGWVMAGTGKASEDNLLTSFLNSAYGLRMKYVPFKGGGRVAKELIEGRADSTVNNPAEQEQYYIDGKSRPLAAFTPARLDMYEDVPTFREKGQNLVYYMQRSIVAPPGIGAEAAAYYQTLFRLVYESKEWQDYMNENSLRRAFLTGEPLKKYWRNEQETHRGLLKRMREIN